MSIKAEQPQRPKTYAEQVTEILVRAARQGSDPEKLAQVASIARRIGASGGDCTPRS